MAFASTTIWEVQTGGSDSANGGGFDVGNASMATDLAATVATGTAPVVTSASYNFTTRDNGAWLFIKAGTNWIPGWYKIASTAGNAATLTATIGSAVKFDAIRGPYAMSTVAGCATTASPTGGTWSIDYSQSASPGIAFTDMVIDGTTNTKFTSTLNPVGVNMVGNVISVTSGTGFTVQRVQISSVSGTTATCDKALGTVSSTGGNGGLGGALASPGMPGGLMIANNFLFIKAGTYSIASASANVATGTFNPTLNTIGISGYSTNRHTTNIDTPPLLQAGVNSAAPIIGTGGNRNYANNLKVDGNGHTGITGFLANTQCIFRNLYALSCATGFPAANDMNLYERCTADTCGTGFNTGATSLYMDSCVATNCTTQGFGGGNTRGAFFRCIAYANAGTGFAVGDSTLVNCVAYGQTGSTGQGFLNGSGGAIPAFYINCVAVNNSQGGFDGQSGVIYLQNCAGYNNSGGNVVNVSGALYSWLDNGFITLTADPFTSSTNFTLNSTAGGGPLLNGTGWPVTFPPLLGTNYPSVGAYQGQAATPGGCPHLAGVGGGLAG